VWESAASTGIAFQQADLFPRPKCSGGPPAGCAMAVAACGYCELLSSSTPPCDGVGLTSLCRCVGESSEVSTLKEVSLTLRS
jgi:hypothetical protein